MITVTVYTRPDCVECDALLAELEALQEEIPHRLALVDVSQDEALEHAFAQVPVVEVGPYRLRAPFEHQKLLVTLRAASDRLAQQEKVGDERARRRRARGAAISPIDRAMYWISRHYLLVFNLLVFLYVGLPFLAPVLMKAGAERPARLIYTVYGGVCHQLAFRSWFLFGEQPAYPRAAAHVDGLTPFGQATGLSEEDLWGARRFIGNDQVGYKVAFCERDVAIYAAILVFGLLYAALGKRLRPLPWYLWLALGVFPIGLDGFSQLLSQPPFHLWAYRESTPLLRTLTGALFGFTTAWFGYPLVDEAMMDTRRLLAAKFQRLKQGA